MLTEMTDREIMDKIINSYEDLINHPEENIEKWKNYGIYSSCLFCKKYFGPPLHYPCVGCPLMVINPAKRRSGCVDEIHNDFFNAIENHFHKEPNLESVISLAKARLEVLKKVEIPDGKPVYCLESTGIVLAKCCGNCEYVLKHDHGVVECNVKKPNIIYVTDLYKYCDDFKFHSSLGGESDE